MFKGYNREQLRNLASSHKKHLSKTNARKLLLILASLFLFWLGGTILWAARLEVPDFSNFEERKVVQSTKIYDHTGTILLNSVNEDVRRSSVPVAEISPFIKNATVAIEDWAFYQHHGIRPTSIARAMLANFTSAGRTQGGSTITQQVVKNALLTKDKTITRKIKEAILSLKLERVLSKDEILGLYLNESPYGGNIYGVEEACQVFFGKSSKDVTLAEAAYLAALPQAPTRYSPYGTHIDELTARKNLVLDKMFEYKLATKEEVDEAKKEVVHFLPQEKQGIKAPHFVFYVRSYLEEKYGRDIVETGGLKVITTLDWDLQQKAEEIVSQYAAENETKFNAHNAGLVIINPKTGAILSMVGSRNYFETENSGNFNVTLAKRQPGSSFKPIVYATAFNQGYTPETVLFDLQTEFAAACGQGQKPADPTDCYKPQNYDGNYRGPMTLRDALAQSINIPAIKVLYLTGIKNSLKTARDMGITSLGDANQYGLTLVLGGGEVTLLELTSAYGVFANDGVRVAPEKIISVTDNMGNTLEENTSSGGEQVLPQNTARLISSILSDNKARAPGYGSRSPLYFDGKDVAAKTGTTNDYKDTWIIGYTPEIVVGAWVGNNDNTPMEKKVAGFVVAPMWHAVMEEALKKIPSTPFTPPEATPSDIKPVLRGIWQGGKTYKIDKISGKLATEYTPPELVEERVIPSVHSILYWLKKEDPRGSSDGDLGDSQFSLWEKPIRAWALAHGYQDQDASTIPTTTDDVHLPEYIPVVSVLTPTLGSTFGPDSLVNISVNATGHFPISQMTVTAGDTVVADVKSAPWNATFSPRSITNTGSVDQIIISVYDTMRNRKDVNLPVFITTGNQAEDTTNATPNAQP